MAPSQSIYQREPQQLPKPHPAIRKLSDQLFVFAFTDEPGHPRENLITAAEIAECIKLDGLLRQGKFPDRWQYLYPTISYHFNTANTLDDRRFAEYNTETGVITHNHAPRPSFEDFGIQRNHVSGARQQNNSLISTRAQEKTMVGAILDSLQRKNGPAGANTSENPKKRRRVESTFTPSSSIAGSSVPNTPHSSGQNLTRAPIHSTQPNTGADNPTPQGSANANGMDTA